MFFLSVHGRKQLVGAVKMRLNLRMAASHLLDEFQHSIPHGYMQSPYHPEFYQQYSRSLVIQMRWE